MGNLCRFEDRWDGALQLKEQDVTALKVRTGFLDVFFSEVSVGAGSYHYAVLCVGIHVDKCYGADGSIDHS